MEIAKREVDIPAVGATLSGTLALPEQARGVVVFVHGSGSSRHSPRNAFVSAFLHEARIATLLFDLLTEGEDADPRARFDIPLLAERLRAATEWVATQPELKGLPVGYFGASTGAAAALSVAADLGKTIAALVSRGGRPDLAGELHLPRVVAPTLLIVGGRDDVVIELNQQALAQMRCEKQLAIVPGATHLFEEHGTLEQVGQLAAEWFSRFF